MGKRIYLFISILVCGIGLLFLHQSYPLDYIYRVMTKQESDANDKDWKPAFKLIPSVNPRSIHRALDRPAVEEAFSHSLPGVTIDQFMENSGTTSFLIYKDSAVIYEAYYNGANALTLNASFSVSKSVFSIIFGQSLASGAIKSIDDPITDYVPELLKLDERFENITLANMLDMRSGLHFDSDVSFPFFTEDKPLIYYATDLQKVLLNRTSIEQEPGQFHYNDYNPNLLGLALERATNNRFQTLVQKGLWNPIGMAHSGLWSTDYRGFPLFESGLAATATDLLRIGIAMLESGFVEGREILSPQWYQRSTQTDLKLAQGTFDGVDWEYQNGWWLIPQEQNNVDYLAMGHLGQYMYISPMNNSIVVRTAQHKGNYSDDDFIDLFRQSLRHL